MENVNESERVGTCESKKMGTEGIQIAQKSSIDHKDYVYIERPYTECERSYCAGDNN